MIASYSSTLGLASFILGGTEMSQFFDLFYILAFLLVSIILVYEGIKRKLNLMAWLIVLAASRLAFIVGTKINAYDKADWSLLFQSFVLPEAGGKVLIGGILLGIIVFLLGIKLFKIPFSSIDSFATAFPIGIIIQRVGCFLLGCCFGKPAVSGFGVQYQINSPAHAHHYNSGNLDSIYSLTPHLHPFQVYEVINGVITLAAVLLLRKRIKSKGGLFVLSIGIYSGIRFLTEFFRDSGAHAMGGETFLGVKLMQWILLVVGLFCLLFLYFRESKKPAPINKLESPRPGFISIFFILGILSILTWSLRNWLNTSEVLVMNLMLIPALVLSAYHFFTEYTSPRYRWGTLVSLILPFFLMSQTWNKTPTDSSRVESYEFFKGGYSGGNYLSTSRFEVSSGGGCSNYDYEAYESTYWNAGVGYGRAKILDNGVFTYGINGSFAQLKETKVDTIPVRNNQSIFSINPYVKRDWKWVGLGFGIHAGNLAWNDFDELELDKPGTGTLIKTIPVYVQAYGRFGPERIAFIDGGISNALPSPFPGMRYELAIGSGFGLPFGNRFRFGVTSLGNFVQAQVVPDKAIVINLTYQFGPQELSVPTYEDFRNKQFMLNLEYRFNHKFRDK